MSETTQALVVAGHGSHLNPESGTPIFQHADTVRQTDYFDEVRESFWKEEPAFREILRTLTSQTVYVVPLFMSEGYFVDHVIPRELRLTDECTLDVDKAVSYTRPVGTHASMASIILHRAESVTNNPTVGAGYGLAVVGHGTKRHAGSARSTRDHVSTIDRLNRFDEVRALFMDEPPYIGEITSHFSTKDVIVVPLFISDGLHTHEDIPAAIGLKSIGKAQYAVPSIVEGTRIWYAGAVGTDPRLADVVLIRAAEAGATLPPPFDDALNQLKTVGLSTRS